MKKLGWALCVLFAVLCFAMAVVTSRAQEVRGSEEPKGAYLLVTPEEREALAGLPEGPYNVVVVHQDGRFYVLRRPLGPARPYFEQLPDQSP